MNENNISIELSGVERLLITNTIYNVNFIVRNGKELSLFGRLGPALDLASFEITAASVNQKLEIPEEVLQAVKSFDVSEDLLVYIKDQVFQDAVLNGLGARIVYSLINKCSKLITVEQT